MQRSKAAVSVEVKQVIGTLCKLLAATGLDAVPTPEAFRRAKFGGGLEVESQFWDLLASILHRSGIVHYGASGQPKEEYRKLVAAGLWQTGYYADWMYRSEEGEGQEGKNFQSKDLLLAVGWLLATGTIEKLLTQQVQQLNKILPTSIPVDTKVSQELQVDLSSLRRLQWLIGNLRHQGRILLSMVEERTRLLHAVSSASLSSTVPSSSDHSSQALKDDCVSMQQLCELLEAYVKWKQVEKVFWTWMDSVVDSHLSEPFSRKPTQMQSASARECPHRNQGLEKLEHMLKKLPIALKGHERRMEGANERRLEKLQGASDTPLPLLISAPPLYSLSQTYRARLQTENTVKHNRYAAEGLQDRATATNELQFSQAAQILLQTEAELLQRREQQRLANRLQLQHVFGKLDELVLIPP